MTGINRFGIRILFFYLCFGYFSMANGQTLNVMSYNIHHGCDIHEKLQIKQIAALIQKDNADIVGLVEVDSVCHRSRRTDQPALLAEMTGMHVRFVRHFAFEGGAYGLALLSRFPILEITNERIPIMTDENGDSTRAFLLATLALPGDKRLKVGVAHLDYRSRVSRIRQVKRVLKLLEDKDVPVMILGDLNATPDSPPVKLLESRFVDVNKPGDKTYPSKGPDKKIDYIMADKQNFVSTLKDTVYPVRYSDHLPIAARIRISAD